MRLPEEVQMKRIPVESPLRVHLNRLGRHDHARRSKPQHNHLDLQRTCQTQGDGTSWERRTTLSDHADTPAR